MSLLLYLGEDSDRVPTLSASSLGQVALAAPPRPVQLTTIPLDACLKSVIGLPPPTHPDRKLPFSASIHIDNEKSFEPIYTMSRRSSLTSQEYEIQLLKSKTKETSRTLSETEGV